MSPSIYVKIERTIFASIVFASPMSADIIKLSNGFMAGVKKIFTRAEHVLLGGLQHTSNIFTMHDMAREGTLVAYCRTCFMTLSECRTMCFRKRKRMPKWWKFPSQELRKACARFTITTKIAVRLHNNKNMCDAKINTKKKHKQKFFDSSVFGLSLSPVVCRLDRVLLHLSPKSDIGFQEE